MEKTNRELLIKEISSRLPYGIKAQVLVWDEEKEEIKVPLKVYSINTDGYVYFESNGYDVEYVDVDSCLLYLRPMSSMTEEEKEEMHNLLSPEGTAIYENDGIALPINHCGEFVPYEFMNRIIQYLLKNHFDFMGLIPKGLAIEITESNNPYK